MAALAHEHAHCGCGGDHQLFEVLDLASLHLQATLVEAASTAAAQAQIAAVRARFASEWHQAAGVFRQRASLIRRGTDPLTGAQLADKAARTAAAKLALEELEKAWQKTITRHWQTAFKLGWSSRGKLPPDTTLEIQTLSPRFKALVEGQHAAAVKFAQDLAQGIVGKPGRQSYAQRAQAYANATEAAFHVAAVDAGEPGEIIHWRLGQADHCIWTGEARVTTHRGLVPIRDVAIGDLVLTHRGRWRRVIATSAKRAAETSASRVAVRLSADGQSVGVTGCHEAWTLDGWVPSEVVAHERGRVLQLPHVRTLRTMFDLDQLAPPHLPSVPAGVRLRPPEVSQGRDLHGVPEAAVGGHAGGHARGPGAHGEDGRGGEARRGGTADALQQPDAGRLQAHPGGWATVRDLLDGGRPAAERLPAPVGVGAGERADPGRLRGAPPERGQDGRPPGEPSAQGGLGAQAGASPWAERLEQRGGPALRHVREDVARASAGERLEDGQALLLEGVPGCLAVGAQRAPEGDDRLSDLRDELRRRARGGQHPEVLLACMSGGAHAGATADIVGELDDDAILWDLTVEEDHSFIVEGIVVANCDVCPLLAASGPYTRETIPCFPRSGSTPCLSSCKCFLVFVKGKAPEAPKTPADQVVSTAIGDPPQAPIGWRVPTDTERDTLRDLEARMNFARRQIALTPPDSAEQRRWIRDRRALNQALRELTERERIYHVPTFSVPEVVSGFNVAATEVTDLVAARGVDGATAAVAGGEAAAAAEGAADVQAAVRLAQATPTLPVVPTAAALKRAALPPPEGEDGTQEGHDAGFDLAEADVPVSAALPAQFTWQTVSVVGLGARHTLALSLSLLRLLAEAPTPYAVEVGPFDDEHWATLTMELGIWLRGPGEEIERLLKDWAEVAPKPGLGVAPYLP